MCQEGQQQASRMPQSSRSTHRSSSRTSYRGRPRRTEGRAAAASAAGLSTATGLAGVRLLARPRQRPPAREGRRAASTPGVPGGSSPPRRAQLWAARLRRAIAKPRLSRMDAPLRHPAAAEWEVAQVRKAVLLLLLLLHRAGGPATAHARHRHGHQRPPPYPRPPRRSPPPPSHSMVHSVLPATHTARGLAPGQRPQVDERRVG